MEVLSTIRDITMQESIIQLDWLQYREDNESDVLGIKIGFVPDLIAKYVTADNALTVFDDFHTDVYGIDERYVLMEYKLGRG